MFLHLAEVRLAENSHQVPEVNQQRWAGSKLGKRYRLTIRLMERKLRHHVSLFGHVSVPQNQLKLSKVQAGCQLPGYHQAATAANMLHSFRSAHRTTAVPTVAE